MVAIASDIAQRCIQLNPHLAGAAPKETDGIAPIDELDLHIHPNWRLSILRNLTNIFPKLQFVATTQPLLVVRSLEGHGLVKLSGQGILEERREQ